jgi:hypothetical protein
MTTTPSTHMICRAPSQRDNQVPTGASVGGHTSGRAAASTEQYALPVGAATQWGAEAIQHGARSQCAAVTGSLPRRQYSISPSATQRLKWLRHSSQSQAMNPTRLTSAAEIAIRMA